MFHCNCPPRISFNDAFSWKMFQTKINRVKGGKKIEILIRSWCKSVLRLHENLESSFIHTHMHTHIYRFFIR